MHRLLKISGGLLFALTAAACGPGVDLSGKYDASGFTLWQGADGTAEQKPTSGAVEVISLDAGGYRLLMGDCSLRLDEEIHLKARYDIKLGGPKRAAAQRCPAGDSFTYLFEAAGIELTADGVHVFSRGKIQDSSGKPTGDTFARDLLLRSLKGLKSSAAGAP